VWTKLDAFAWQSAPGTFSGDNFELAHKLLFDPGESIKAGAVPQVHPQLHDVLIIGGGVAGLTTAWKLRDRMVRLLEAAPETGGVSRSESWQGIQYSIGAAYIIDPAAESEDARELAGFRFLEELGLRKAGDAFAATTWEDGVLHRYRARTAVFAAPLFLAPKIIPFLPQPQRTAIGSLTYRSYVVANVLLKRPANRIFANPAFRNGYELTRVHGIDVRKVPAEEISGRKVYSDATWRISRRGATRPMRS
jgi:hypothetical protein